MNLQIGSSRAVSRRRWIRNASFASGCATLISCGIPSTSKEAEEPPAPPEAVSALRAITFAYGKARTKAQDIDILRISNLNLEKVPGGEGKAGAWQFQFVSRSNSSIYNVRYAVADELPSFREGAWDAGTQAYRPDGMRSKPFVMHALRCDSTEAYEIAVENAQSYLQKQTPESLPPVHFLLELTDIYALPTWRVYWGNSLSTAEYSVYVDANQSKFVSKS
jgi:hypothetical protein